MKLSKYTQHSVEEYSNTGIYKITFEYAPRLIYIGQASRITGKKPCQNGFYYRWLTHLRDLENNRHHNTRIQRIVNKHGLHQIKFHILEYINGNNSIEYFNGRETHYVNEYKEKHVVLNFSEEAKSFRGMKHTKETKAKMSAVGKGRKMHPNTYKAIMEANIGRVVTEETRRKLSFINRGRVVSQETRKRLSETHKGKPLKNSRQVISCKGDEILQFPNAVEAAEHFKVSYSYMRVLCRENKTYNNYKFYYETGTTRTNKHSFKEAVICFSDGQVETYGSMKEVYTKLNISKNTLKNHLKNRTRLRNNPGITIYYKLEYDLLHNKSDSN